MNPKPRRSCRKRLEVNEELRLRYRYIDLRRTVMQEKMKVRRDVTRVLRNFLDDNEFFEIETPYLTKPHLKVHVITSCPVVLMKTLFLPAAITTTL